MAKRLFLTGAGGFLGSHILEEVLVSTDWEVVTVASWSHKGVPARISDSIHYQEHKDRVTVITHDLSAPITQFMTDQIGHIDYVIHAAADSHVDRSIAQPVPFILNNVNLTLNMLEWARVAKPEVFIQISTDEVYGSAWGTHSHKEWEPHIPSNPYAASKGAQEDIAIAYWRTYGVPVVITNTMNLIGERQDPEKFVPKTIRSVVNGEPMTIHVDDEGKPGSRHYIHCRNMANALLFIINNTTPALFTSTTDPNTPQKPDRYHVAGQEELDNISMARLIAEIVGKELLIEEVSFHKTRPGHDPRYSLDSSKIRDLGWEPPIPFHQSLENLVKWSLENDEWLNL